VFVLDASVAAAWFLGDESNAYSAAARERLRLTHAIVPAIFPLEIGNICLVAGRRGRLSEAQSLQALRALGDLPIEVRPLESLEQLPGIVSLARDQGLSTYDAAYLDLAMREDLPLATHDRSLRKACLAVGVALL
jgi:predicted nucleic acid-binding protein